MDDAARRDSGVWDRPGRTLASLVIPVVITAMAGAVVHRYVILEQYAPTASETPLVKLADLAGIAFLLALAGLVPAAFTVALLRRLSASPGRIALAAVLGNVIPAVLGYPIGFGMLGITNAIIVELVLVAVGSLSFSIALLIRRSQHARGGTRS